MADDYDSDPEVDSESHGSSNTVAQSDKVSTSCSSERCQASEPYNPASIEKRQGKQNCSFISKGMVRRTHVVDIL